MENFKGMAPNIKGSTHCHSLSEINKKLCPICGQPNRCGEKEIVNGIELSRCWCAYETFPKIIFEKVPKDKYRKACICQKCLYQYKPKNADILKLRKILDEFISNWKNDPKTSWAHIYSVGKQLLEWKTHQNIVGLWKYPPKIITATMDDGMGQGLKMIHLFSRVAGLEIVHLGLMQSPKKIINECQKQNPDFLGMTILQFETEELLKTIIPQIPKQMQVLVGGPIFNTMPDNALQNKKYHSFNHISEYLHFLCNYEPKAIR
jgi:methylmalonyl-CoA mutase cobalamin-binding subunit